MSKIEVKSLSVSFGSHQVLRDINLTIPDRQIVAIIGPSGCGKTTLLKSLNRLLDLNEDVSVAGDIFVDGENIYAPGMDVTVLRKKVGFLPQRPYPLPMSIFQNVAFGPRIHGLDASRGASDEKAEKKDMSALVEHYLRLAGLWEEVKDRLHARAAKLSIAWRWRACCPSSRR